MTDTKKHQDARLRIGAVSRLTDLSVHVLRKWEKRYGAVEPVRTPGGGRLYSRQDVRRLALIKQLTQAGAPLTELARLSLDDLEALASTALESQPGARDDPGLEPAVRVAVIGDALPTLLQADAATLANLELVALAESATIAKRKLAGASVDLLVQELPTVHADEYKKLRESMDTLGAKAVIAVYGFGSREALGRLRKSGAALMRAPIDPLELQHVSIGLIQQVSGHRHGPALLTPTASDQAVPPPRFSPEAVALAATSTPAMRCECPHHLADIISSLIAFERYSEECESQNESDAALHRFLGLTAGRSRVLFEEALARVAQAEGIDLSS
jgi:DNA-binding transcriptional MerR regulator